MTIKAFYALCLVAWALTGCFSVPSLKDPFGTYEAKVTMNDRNAEARETVARYDRDARIAESEQAADAKVSVARSWSNTLPNVALIVALGVVTVVLIQWSGRITLARIKYGELPQREVRSQIPTLNELKRIATQRNQQVRVVDGVVLLIDKSTGQIVKRRTL
jgi:hypothetical protein